MELLNPIQQTQAFIQKAWRNTIQNLAPWIAEQLIPSLVYGGMGIKGLTSTEFWKFINSAEGLSELGIRPQDTQALLDAYIKSFIVRANGTELMFQFGNEAELKFGTPHWATGTGKLRVNSWLDWILDGEPVNDAGYVPRSDIPTEMQHAIRLNNPLGGLMLPGRLLGSAGTWRFPYRLQRYAEDWLRENMEIIEKVIGNQIALLFQKEVV